MRTVFISDAHLRDPDDSNYMAMLAFLESIQGKVSTICILGDLFDFRIGLPDLEFPEHEPVIDALRGLVKSGARIIYLEGNHDFNLGVDFASSIGAEIHAGPVDVEIDGRRIHVCHGDLVNRADWRYRLLHFVLRSRAAVICGQAAPKSLVQRIRRGLQGASRRRYGSDRNRWDYRSIIAAYAQDFRSMGYDAMVIGHFHMPFIEADSKFTLLSLGDWIGDFSYGLLENGDFSLNSFSWPR